MKAEHIKKDVKRFKAMKKQLDELIEDDEKELKKIGRSIRLNDGSKLNLPKGFKNFTQEQKDKWIESQVHSDYLNKYIVAAAIPAAATSLVIPMVGPPLAATMMGAAYGAGKLHEITADNLRRRELGEAIEKISFEKGRLHRDLGIPEGEKIPTEKLKQLLPTADPKLARRIRFALMFRKDK